MSYIFGIIELELKLAMRSRGQWLSQLMLFILMVTFVPFGVGVNHMVLQEVAVGFVWISLLLSTALSLPQIFQKDFDYGMLEQYALGAELIEFTAAAKLASYWIISCLPLALISPVLASMLFLPASKAMAMIPSILVGGAGCAALGSLAAALMIGNPKAGAILMFLVLPFFIPVLIFGSIASTKAIAGELISPEFSLISGFALLTAPVSVWIQGRLIKKACE